MRILGFDTATAATAVALWDEGGDLTLEGRDDPPPGARPGHVRRLMPLIAELLGRAGSSWAQIDRIAVGLGPGTFTGIRIAVSTARALGQALSIPLVGISTLEALALGALPDAEARRFDVVLAVLDARRGEAFVAGWRPDQLARADPAPLSAAQAVGPEPLAGLVTALNLRVLAVGDGAIKFREVLECSGASIPQDDSDLHRVSAMNHCRLASDRRTSDPDAVRPAYLRLPDAEITRRSARTE